MILTFTLQTFSECLMINMHAFWEKVTIEFGSSPSKLCTEFPYGPAIPLPGIYTKELEINIQTETCMQKLMAAFTIATR